jgi:hypothetical protein
MEAKWGVQCWVVKFGGGGSGKLLGMGICCLERMRLPSNFLLLSKELCLPSEE